MSRQETGAIKEFMEKHFRHFNAATLVDAARALRKFLDENGALLVSLGGAMSTAEIGVILSRMIREGLVAAVSCTGANLEEDLFNLVAHEQYLRLPHYRELTAAHDEELRDRGLNRVTDTCIPEVTAVRRLEKIVASLWSEAGSQGESRLPHEYLYEALSEGALRAWYEIDAADSWLVAAAEADLPIFVPGWEDSTLGNIFAARVLSGELQSATVRGGIDYMVALAQWYRETSESQPIGMVQIAGGISGDFPICVVPMLNQDLGVPVPLWSYFCQISDSTTSYGSYSGAVPNEKISWGKLGVDTPRFIIESDATIVAPLLFGHVLGC